MPVNHDNILLDNDLPSKSQRIFHWDETDQRVIIEDRQDVTAILEANKARAQMGFDRKKTIFWPVGSIPGVIWERLTKEWNERKLSWEERQKALKAFLNDPDNKVWKYDQSLKL